VIREQVGDALRLAAAVTVERIRQDRRRAGESFAPLFRCIEEHVFDADFGAAAAWSRSGVGRGAAFPLDVPLASYLDELRVDTARRMLELGGGRIPAGRAAVAVGLSDYRTWSRTFRRCTGESPKLVRRPDRLDPDFDDRTWHHAWHGTLSVAEVRWLLQRLRRPEAAAPGPPPGLRSCAGMSGTLTEAEAREAVEQAAAGIRQRLLDDAEGLPDAIVEVLEDLAEHLFDPDFSGSACRERTGVSDTALTTRVSFYLGDSLLVLVEKLRVEVAMRLAGDLRFEIARVAEAVGWSPRTLLNACNRRAGAPAGEVRRTLRRTASHPDYRLWCKAGRGALAPADVLALEDLLRRLHPEELVPAPAMSLAVRTDVDPRRVASVLELYRAVPQSEVGALRKLDDVFRTHPEYSAAHWYVHWVRDRLGRQALDGAWEDWRVANRDLEELLRQPRSQRVGLVRDVRRFQTDAFLWLLVDCVDVRLFHDGAESEHYADLALAAAEARWAVDPSPESAGLHGLALALKANALRRRNELQEASEKFEQALAVIRSVKTDPWIIARSHSLYSCLFYRRGQEAEALRALFVASANYKRAGDELGRLRCIIDRTSAWFSMGKDPSRILTICIAALDRYPAAAEFRCSAHINRILASIYLTDRLSGNHLPRIRRFRQSMPPTESTYIAAEYQQVDGLIAALSQEPEIAGAALKRAASWFEEHGFTADAAVCWLQFSWATLSLDGVSARQAALTACAYMQLSGFKSQGLREVALRIHSEALQGELNRDLLRWGILQIISSRGEARLAEAAEPF
jgi:transcriptional regulator GlxA family with amidase domain/tetratricopeptide (TPR) repeat protein